MSKKFRIPLAEPNVGLNEALQVMVAINNNEISTTSDVPRALEEAFAAQLGLDSNLCVAVNSGTTALICGINAILDFDSPCSVEIAVPALTFPATINAILASGHEPRIVDVDPNTWLLSDHEYNYDLPVHLYGNLAPISDKCVVGDAAEALGNVTPSGHTMCYSFNGNKTITCGAGGMVVCENIDVAKTIRKYISQGRNKVGDVVIPGLNLKMPGICAAVGVSQLLNLSWCLQKKLDFSKMYRAFLEEDVVFQAPTGDSLHWWLNCILLDSAQQRLRVERALLENRIECRRIFKPLGMMPAYNKYDTYCPNAMAIYDRGLCLPSGTGLVESDIIDVCNAIKEAL